MDFSIIRFIRKSKKISLREMGEITGLSLPTLIDFESNNANPTISTIDRIAKVLKLSTVEMLLYCEAEEKARKKLEQINLFDFIKIRTSNEKISEMYNLRKEWREELKARKKNGKEYTFNKFLMDK